MSAEVARVLREAADRIERSGWCRMTYRSEDGRICAATAISDASPGSRDVAEEAEEALLRFLGPDVPVACVQDWNDLLVDDQKQAVAVLRDAAAAEAETAAATPHPSPCRVPESPDCTCPDGSEAGGR